MLDLTSLLGYDQNLASGLGQVVNQTWPSADGSDDSEAMVAGSERW